MLEWNSHVMSYLHKIPYENDIIFILVYNTAIHARFIHIKNLLYLWSN